MKHALVIGVGGCSGSGKTTLARGLVRRLNGIHFQIDHYYRDLSHLSYEERCAQNFDHPDALESALMITQLRDLAHGRAIEQPHYDFVTHTRRMGVSERVDPAKCVVVVDGIFALHFEGLRELYDLSVYVETPDDVCYARRLARDTRERGRTEALVAAHYAATVRPMAERYVLPSARRATLTVPGTQSLEWSVEAVLGALRRHGAAQTTGNGGM